MTHPAVQTDPVAQLFRDVVLVLSGVFAIRGTDDETICQVARGLERVYRRARGRTGKAGGGATPSGGTAPHPAVLGLLRLIEPEETKA